MIPFVNALEPRKNGFTPRVAIFPQCIGVFHQGVRCGFPSSLVRDFFRHRAFLDFLHLCVNGCMFFTCFRHSLGIRFRVPNRRKKRVEFIERREYVVVASFVMLTATFVMKMRGPIRGRTIGRRLRTTASGKTNGTDQHGGEARFWKQLCLHASAEGKPWARFAATGFNRVPQGENTFGAKTCA